MSEDVWHLGVCMRHLRRSTPAERASRAIPAQQTSNNVVLLWYWACHWNINNHRTANRFYLRSRPAKNDKSPKKMCLIWGKTKMPLCPWSEQNSCSQHCAYFCLNGRDFLADSVPVAEANMALGLKVRDNRKRVPKEWDLPFHGLS